MGYKTGLLTRPHPRSAQVSYPVACL